MTGSAQYASPQGLVCCICAQPVSLETSKTDERGNAVHEECYVRKIIRKFRLNPIRLTEDWHGSVLARFELRLGITDNC